MTVDTGKLLTTEDQENALPLMPVTPEIWAEISENTYDTFLKGLAEQQGFTGQKNQVLVLPDKTNGKLSAAFCGVDSLDDMWALSAASAKLPAATYKIDDRHLPMNEEQKHRAAVGWALAQYQFKIKEGSLDSAPIKDTRLHVDQTTLETATNEIQSTWLVRDLINAPANVLNTTELGQAALDLAAEFNAAATLVQGEELERDFPLVHTVGRASDNKPRLVHFNWNGSDADSDAMSLLIVGKGVTFDTGGVQIKPGASMESMKKDMGGAATALGLARMIMANDLPVNLNVVIPIAENSVSSNAYRPQDVYTARDGTEVEISHTDAEGRLILADALSFGVEKADPDLIIDYATLTGAQRIANGLSVGGVFTNSVANGRAIEDLGQTCNDDIQFNRMFEVYRPLLKSNNGALIASSPKSGGGPGATLAAMFLEHFIRAAKEDREWFHFDINGANPKSLPGRPVGGEAIGMRVAYSYIKNKLAP